MERERAAKVFAGDQSIYRGQEPEAATPDDQRADLDIRSVQAIMQKLDEATNRSKTSPAADEDDEIDVQISGQDDAAFRPRRDREASGPDWEASEVILPPGWESVRGERGEEVWRRRPTPEAAL